MASSRPGQSRKLQTISFGFGFSGFGVDFFGLPPFAGGLANLGEATSALAPAGSTGEAVGPPTFRGGVAFDFFATFLATCVVGAAVSDALTFFAGVFFAGAFFGGCFLGGRFISGCLLDRRCRLLLRGGWAARQADLPESSLAEGLGPTAHTCDACCRSDDRLDGPQLEKSATVGPRICHRRLLCTVDH